MFCTRSIQRVNTETFKGSLDKWFKIVPEEPDIDKYGMCVAAESNSIVEHKILSERYGLALPHDKNLIVGM